MNKYLRIFIFIGEKVCIYCSLHLKCNIWEENTYTYTVSGIFPLRINVSSFVENGPNKFCSLTCIL